MVMNSGGLLESKYTNQRNNNMGDKSFTPFIEQYCFLNLSDIQLERVFKNSIPSPGGTTTYLVTVYPCGLSNFYKLLEICRLFYGDNFRVGYATEEGIDGNPLHIIVEVVEPEVFHGYNMPCLRKLTKEG